MDGCISILFFNGAFNLDAIKNEQVFAFDSNSYFSRPSLRIMDGAEQLREAIIYSNKNNHCKRNY